MKARIQLIFRVLFGLMFINAGLNKLFHYLPAPQDLPPDLLRVSAAMAEVAWLMPLVGVAEIVGGVLFIPNKFRAIGALVILPVMTGILLTHLYYAPSGMPVALVLLAILIWVMTDCRRQYKALLR